MTIIVNCLLFWFALATGPLLVLLALLMSGHKPEPKQFDWRVGYSTASNGGKVILRLKSKDNGGLASFLPAWTKQTSRSPSIEETAKAVEVRPDHANQ